MTNELKNEKGFTLIEIVVSLSLFTMIVIMAVGIFQSVITSQQRAVVAQSEQESLKYVLEVMSKDIRSATASTTNCWLAGMDAATNNIFNVDTALNLESDIFYFMDKDDVCTYYKVVDSTLLRTKGTVTASTTPGNVSVTAFNFVINDNLITDPVNTIQPFVTFSLAVEGRVSKAIEKQPLVLQTTISSRFYE